MAFNYEKIYNENYFSGKNSFFWKGGYGGYGVLGQRYFDNLFAQIKPHLITKRSATALDIGCAYGFMLARLPNNYRRFGIDISAYAIENAEKRLPQAVLKVSGIENRLPFRKDFFDLIFLNDVLEHLEKPQKALENIWLMLRPRGILYITTPNHNTLRKLFYAYADKSEHHISLFPHNHLLNLLEKVGFKVIDHWTYFHFGFYLRRDDASGVESGFILKK